MELFTVFRFNGTQGACDHPSLVGFSTLEEAKTYCITRTEFKKEINIDPPSTSTYLEIRRYMSDEITGVFFVKE